MPEKDYRISAIIPTKNRLDDLLECVRSVMIQNRLPDELIIVDQSIDDMIKIKVEQLWQASKLNNTLIYILDPDIAGLVEAKKRGVTESQADIIMFLEDDVVLAPNYIHVLEQGFIEHPEMYGCCGVVKKAPKQNSLYRILFRVFHCGIFFDPRVGIHGQPSTFNGGLIQSTYLSGGLSAYRREVFDRIKFDTKNGFFMLEDIDFSTRAARVFGLNAFFINTGAVLEHALSPVNRAVLKTKYEKKFREYTVFYKKNNDQPLAMLNYLWLIVGLILESGFEAIRSTTFGSLCGGFQGLIKGIRWHIHSLN